MTIRFRTGSLFLLAAVYFAALPLPALAQEADFIAAVGAGPSMDRDYVLEGTVVTVWGDSFLLSDGTGQIVVDVLPYDTDKLDLHGQDYVQVTGRPVNGKLKPIAVLRAGQSPVLFTGPATLPPLPEKEVIENTRKHRMQPPVRHHPDTPPSGPSAPSGAEGGAEAAGAAPPPGQEQLPSASALESGADGPVD